MVDFPKRILFSDEAHFWLNGYVNKQNCRIWSEANPQVHVKTPLHPETLTVCLHAEIVEVEIEVVSPSNVPSGNFTELNRTVTCMVLKANDRRTSCPCHDEFRGPRSDYVRQADKPQTLDHLEDNICHVIADIRPQMLEKVIENWTSRFDYIRASRGSPVPEVLFKM
ncbi:hypothetical protein TNCV_3225271 [Trichonephila clavipes]|nr:hypothetical protein TNCV_3225271 [Trichonephila clavipes]